ncbi:cysteine repeat modular protein 4, putative (CRMP4) [Plasmodium malariae]|uniref:Cysteine repeat modular protein 4, putative (CRMP4) n=1 Tax=Plasmodium malariae TaxID=5858 RepID=A0A1A8WCX7_PLAMA|nr:cysteine repeat modular protein 4, putative (CRMP4) [Plasmodium malariae]
MKYKKSLKIFSLSFFIIFFVIFLKNIKASIRISNFTYNNGSANVNVELFETEYISILDTRGDGISESDFEINEDYLISDISETNNCNVINNNLGEVISKEKYQNTFLFVQKRDAKIYIKDKKNSCLLISPIDKSVYSIQKIEQKNELIKIGDILNCNDKNIDKFTFYFNLLENIVISENEKCDKIVKSAFVKNAEVFNCTGNIGRITNIHELNNGTYYICFINNNLSLVLNRITIDKTIIHNTFYCDFENPNCSIRISTTLFNNIPNITDETVLLKPRCNDNTVVSTIKNDHKLDGEYYTFNFNNNNTYYLEAYKPITCFLGTPCVIKLYTLKEKISYIINDIESTTFSWSDNICDKKIQADKEINIHTKEQDEHIYIISDEPLTNENNLCSKIYGRKYLPLFTVDLVKKPEYNIYYTIINNKIINYKLHFFEYNNYLGPYLKYECSHNNSVKDENGNLKDNNDNKFIYKNEELNFVLDYYAITMRLCLKQFNYYDIGSVKIERLLNFETISLQSLNFTASVSLYNEDNNTKILKFAIKENENCYSDNGFFIESKDDLSKKISYKNILVDQATTYKATHIENLDKFRYYVCMCSIEENCKENNNFRDYYSYTNISINNDITPLEKKKMVCKLFSKCSFTITFHSTYVSDRWVPKYGRSCNTSELVNIEVNSKLNEELNDYTSNKRVVDFNIYYHAKQMNISLLNKDIVICGNYGEQSFNFSIENDFFLVYNNVPNGELDIINIGHLNLCNNRKILFIYSYYNGETKLSKKIEIDEKTNINKVKLKIEYEKLKNNEIYFIRECHYCHDILTYNYEEDTYIFQNTIKNPQLYWGKRKLGKMNYKFTNKNINIYNCSDKLIDNHTLTSVLFFDGPFQEIDFYCSMDVNCSHKEKFYLLWYHYFLFIEVSETKRIRIFFQEILKDKPGESNTYDSIRISEIILNVFAISTKELKPGPYKIIYSRKINDLINENYIGTFHFIGPLIQQHHVVREKEINFFLDGYFKNIENNKIKIVRYKTCNFQQLLEDKSESNNHDVIMNEVSKDIQICTYHNDYKLVCKYVKSVNNRFHLCWCYEIHDEFCNSLKNFKQEITKISPVESFINPLIQISKSSYSNLINYNVDNFVFIIEDDCTDIKNFNLKSKLNEEKHIIDFYKKLKFPKKYDLCVCTLEENISCDKKEDFKRLNIKMNETQYYVVGSYNLDNFNKGINPVLDFNFSLDFVDELKKGNIPAIVFFPGPTEYNEYICVSGISCRTIIKMKSIIDMSHISTSNAKRKEMIDNNKNNQMPTSNGQSKEAHNTTKSISKINTNSVYFTLSDTKECKNEYEKIFESEKGSILVAQEIEFIEYQLIDAVYNLGVNVVPTDITKSYEICVSFKNNDKYYYNVGNVVFYGIYNENMQNEIISGVPFSFEIKQFYSKYNLFIRFVYEKFGDTDTCSKSNSYSEKIFLVDSVKKLLEHHEEDQLEDDITSYKWKNLMVILDADSNSYLTSYQNNDGSHNLFVCSCYELSKGYCDSDISYSAKTKKYRVHTAILREPKINSTLKFLKPFSLKLETTKVLNGSIRIFPVDIMEDLSKLCIELNQRKFFLTYQAEVDDFDQKYNIIINFLSQGIVVCWCSKDKCEDSDYLTKVGFFKINSPHFLEVHTDINGYFSFEFLNELININDRVTFVDANSICTYDNNTNLFDDTIHLDNNKYQINWEQSIEIYGKPRKIVKYLNENFIWVSKNYKITNDKEKYIKICYCFYFNNENCKDTKNYVYIGLVYNNIVNQKIIQNNYQNDQVTNLNYFNKDSLKFVALNSFNDYNRNICNDRNNQSAIIVPFFKSNVFDNSIFISKVLNIFKKHYKNELNFVVCYRSFYYGSKSMFLLKGIEINEIPEISNSINYNYELSQSGFILDSEIKNIDAKNLNMRRKRNLLLSLENFKFEKNIFYNYFFSQLYIKYEDNPNAKVNDKYIESNYNKAIIEKLKTSLDKISEDPRINLNEVVYYKSKGGIFNNFNLENIIFFDEKKIVLCCHNGDYIEVQNNDNNEYYINWVPKVKILLESLNNYHPNFEKDNKGQNIIMEQFSNIQNKINRNDYLMIEFRKEIGFYKNHVLIHLKDTFFEIKIYGKDIPYNHYTLYIIKFNNSCYNIDKNLFYIENSHFDKKINYIVFNKIQISTMNNYKICILDKTQNMHYGVGILNITNYYVVNDSFFDDNYLPSNIEKMNIILNVCVNAKLHSAYIIKRNDSFSFTLDMEKMIFLKKSEKLNQKFPELQNHHLISCKSKSKGTIILTKSHIFFYSQNNKFSFSTKHNLFFPVDVDFDENFVYINDLYLKKIARLQILSNGIPVNIIIKARTRRSINNKELNVNQRNMGIFKKKTIIKDTLPGHTNNNYNIRIRDIAVNSKFHGDYYSEVPEKLKKILLPNKSAPKNEAVMLNNTNKGNKNNHNEYVHPNFLNLSTLNSHTKNQKIDIIPLQHNKGTKTIVNGNSQEEQMQSDDNVLKENLGTLINKKKNLISNNLRELYYYLQKYIYNNSLTQYLRKLLNGGKVSKKRKFLYNFLEFFKNRKNNKNEEENYQKRVSPCNVKNTNEQAERLIDSNVMLIESSDKNMRKKRSVTGIMDQSIYDNIIQTNIRNFINVVQTPNYLSNNLDFLDIKNIIYPLHMNLHENLLYILDSTKHNFFSYNLRNKEIIELEEYNFSSHKFMLNNPLNFSLYHEQRTEYTTHRNYLAFVTQMRSNEIKIIDLNQKKYKIVKALKLRKGYKHNNINKVEAIEQNLIIITSQVYDNNLFYHYHFNSFDQYFYMSFNYTFQKNYNSNDNLNVVPEIDKYSDSIIFFCFLNSKGKCTNIDELTNLNISHDTGIITGKLNYFGIFQLKIFAKSHFQYKINTYKNLYSYCDIGKEFNIKKRICESCPIGTFWDGEKLKCEKCDKYRKNTSTLKSGSKLITDCLCSPGYEYSEKSSSCEQCKPGYYKTSTGNFVCIKGCLINEESITYGAKSYEEMLCKCIEGYYRKKDKCILCLKNHYCPGNEITTMCDKNKTSPEGSKSAIDCKCKENFIYNNNNGNCSYCASIAKVTGDVIYCSLCNPKYLDKNIFSIANEHNYGLTNTMYSYHEDFVLQDKLLQYAYYDKNNAEGNYINFIPLNNDSLNVLKNNNYGQNTHIFSIEVDTPNPTNCLFCESGYFIDIKKNKCIPCNSRYCEGFSKGPKGCPKNSVVNIKNASSIFDCQCKRGYGSLNERRNEYHKKLICKVCPKNFFKHNISDEFCLPCPNDTYTLSEGSQSIINCLPKEGYFLLMFRNIDIAYLRYKFDVNSENRIYSYFENNEGTFDDDVYDLFLNHNFKKFSDNVGNKSNRNLHNKTRNNQQNAQNNKYTLKNLRNLGFLERTSLFYMYTVLLKNIEENYKWESDRMLNVTCHINMHLKKNPNFTVTYKPNLESCINNCKTNVYCTGVEFSRKNVEYTQVFLKNNQKKIVGYFKCKLFYYQNIYDYTSSNLDKFLNENVENSIIIRNIITYTDYILRNGKNIIFTCSINRDRKYLLYKYYQVIGCFIGKFCPGINTPYLISCPTNSTTVVSLASNVDKCLCLQGYSYIGIVSHRCSVCERGTFKNSIGNFKCENCPLSFSTTHMGSTNINDCSCTPGSYLTFDSLQNFINSEKINYKNIKDQYFIVPKKKDTNIYYTTEIAKISLNNVNGKDDNIVNKILNRDIAVCRPCSLDNHYCEGGLESNILFNNTILEGKFHTLPKKCPKELVIPQGIKQRSSLSNCLCIHGKILRTSKENTVECFPCPPNTFKENEYDNSCSGVCPHFSTTFVGSSYENQCFCKNNYYFVTPEDEETRSNAYKKSCKICPKGAICNRGFNVYLFLKLLKDRAYNNINVLDHENPYPIHGYYAVYKEKNTNKKWNPLDDNNDFKYTYPYYNLLLFIQKNIESKNYFFFEKSQKLYLNKEFIEQITEKNALKKKSNINNKKGTHNTLFNPGDALSFIQNENTYKILKKSNGEITTNYFKKIIHSDIQNKFSSTLQTTQNVASSFLESSKILRNHLSNDTQYLLEEMFNKYVEEANELKKKNNKFERLPDIHACTIPDRCLGTITNLCAEGSTGYQCNNCAKNFDMNYFKSNCYRCRNLFYEIIHIILLKLIYYIIVILIVSLNYSCHFNKLYVSGTLMKIWFNCSFTFIAYGFFSPNISSFITKYWYIYKTVFLCHLKFFSYYVRVGCFLDYYNIDISYNKIWYIQKYMNIFAPFFDALLITVLLYVIIQILKLFYKNKIQLFEQLLPEIPELKGKYNANHLNDQQNKKKIPKKKKKKKIYIFSIQKKNKEEQLSNEAAQIHDIEKNCDHNKEKNIEQNDNFVERNINYMNLLKRKNVNITGENELKYARDEIHENSLYRCEKNEKDFKYELKYVKRDNKMYNIFLNETIDYIYDKRIFGPWHFFHRKNEKLRKKFLIFLKDTLPCYVLMVALSLPYVLLETIQLFYCKPIKYKSQKTESYLAYLTTQECKISSNSFLVGNIVLFLVLFFYISTWLVLLFLYSNRKNVNIFNILLRNLLSGYRQGKEIFEFIFLLKNIILVCVIAFNIHYNIYYIVLVTLILTIFAILEIHSNPFDGRSLNILNKSLHVGSVLNIFISLIIWGSFYWNYEKFFLFPILIILSYHLYMLYNIVREIIMSRHFIRTITIIDIKTVGYDSNNIKNKNYKIYYKIMNKIKFFLNKNQKKKISEFTGNRDFQNNSKYMSKENMKFEPIENIIKRYNLNLNTTTMKDRKQKNEMEENKKKEVFFIKKNNLPINTQMGALIWYDEQNEDLLFQMPYENKFCFDFDGNKSKNQKRNFCHIIPSYVRDKRIKKNIKYFVLAIIEIIDKFLDASNSCSIYENWFDFSIRFAFVYISWIKKINRTNIILPNSIDQIYMNVDEFIFIPLFYKCDQFVQAKRKRDLSKEHNQNNYTNEGSIEMLEKKNSFENTEIKISRSYGSYKNMGSLKNRIHADEKKVVKNEDLRRDISSGNDSNSSNFPKCEVNNTKKNSAENVEMDVLNYLKKKEKKKKKVKKKEKKKYENIGKENSHQVKEKECFDNLESIFNYSLDVFTSEMFNQDSFNILISLFELYIAMKTLRAMDLSVFFKLYELYHEKYIKFEKSLIFYINKLRDEIKLEIEEIDNEINKGDTTEKMRVQKYYYYKEELNKRRKLEEELLCKISSLEECIEANNRSQYIRNMLAASRGKNGSGGNVDDDINYIFSLLQNEGTYKLNHSKKE